MNKLFTRIFSDPIYSQGIGAVAQIFSVIIALTAMLGTVLIGIAQINLTKAQNIQNSRILDIDKKLQDVYKLGVASGKHANEIIKNNIKANGPAAGAASVEHSFDPKTETGSTTIIY